ncbi:MAG TPA: glycosyltransferase [Candidatus Sulfotelmatobacter sp.]|jgi:poly-beta-1,6-N-acetyl-D-glucosamine synthase
MMTLPRYVLITPARNEAQFIELCLQSVMSQTVKPVRWVIVSDGSTDGTDDIVRRYSSENPWIELVRMPERRERNFAGKVLAFNAGCERLQGLEYEAIGSLDGDASFDSEYFFFLLAKLSEDLTLGLVGTPFREGSSRVYDYRFVSQEHVSGICQLFRRQCFEDIGGYVAVKGGSIDHIAVITARMKGWKTRTFTEKECIHHREIAKAQGGALKSKFKYGGKDYALGNHPCWELSRVAYQMTKKPYVVGGLALGAGYAWAAIRRVERPVSAEFVAFHRGEQWQRLKRFFGSGKDSATPAWPRPAERTE